MRILVFGAGVLGSHLAHILVRGGNDVTVLARGKRAEQLRKDGIVIRHYFQRKTTMNEVKVIHELLSDDRYDIIFVVMKYNDFPSVLPILAENQSPNIVLIGNNADAHGMQKVIQEKSIASKNVIFGFLVDGGRREANGRVVSIHGGGEMIVGSLDGEVPIKPLLTNVFKHNKFKLTYHDDIDAWLKSHIVLIVALNSISYLHDFDMRKVSNDKKRLMQAILVMDEGFRVLETLGYTITPAQQVNFIRKHRRVVYYGLRIVHKLPFMKLVDGSFSEIAALYDSFDKLKHQANLATPYWDSLEAQALSKFNSSNQRFKGIEIH